MVAICHFDQRQAYARAIETGGRLHDEADIDFCRRLSWRTVFDTLGWMCVLQTYDFERWINPLNHNEDHAFVRWDDPDYILRRAPQRGWESRQNKFQFYTSIRHAQDRPGALRRIREMGFGKPLDPLDFDLHQ
jgi:hypothetical protein